METSPGTHSSLFTRLFPGLLHWLRLPGIIGFSAVSLGIGAGYGVSWESAAFMAGGDWGRLLAAAAAAFLGAGIVIRQRLLRFGAFFLFAFAVAFCHRAGQIETFRFLHSEEAAAGSMILTGSVRSAPLPYFENFRFMLRIDSVCAPGGAESLCGKTVICIASVEPPLYGSVTIAGSYAPPRPRSNPFAYDEYTALMAQGIWGTLTARTCETVPGNPNIIERLAAGARGTAVALLCKVKNFDNRALLQASFLGDTEFLSPFIKTTFRKSGLYHLVSISGLNTAMFMAAVYFCLGFFRLRPAVKHCLCAAALWAYLPFVGFIPSLFRATIMATLVIAAFLFEKKNYAFHTLGIAGIAWLALSPESLFGPGFQLSFGATAGLLLLYPVMDRYSPQPQNAIAGRIVRLFLQSLFISIATFLATAGVLLYHFGTVSVFGLFANLVAVAAMTGAMWAFFAGLFLQITFPLLSAIPLWFSERCLDLVVWIGSLANNVPWSQVTFPAPTATVVALTAAALVGFAAVNRDYLKQYALLAVVAITLCFTVEAGLTRAFRHTEAVLFSAPGLPLAGIRWPDGSAWLVAPELRKATISTLGMRIVPWFHHTPHGRCSRMVTAADLPPGADSFLAGLPVFARTRIDRYKGESSFFPCPGCTLTLSPAVDRGTIARIATAGADTTLLLSTAAGATVLRFSKKGIRTRHSIPAGHPLFGVP